MSIRVSLNRVRSASVDMANDVKEQVSGAFQEVKHDVEVAAGKIVGPVVDALPVLPSLPEVQIQPPVKKRGAGMFRLTQLQEARRQDDPNYDPPGAYMSKTQERLLLRGLFYLFSFAAIAFLVLAFVFQFGIGQASQAAIWSVSAMFLGGALALNTRVPRKEPTRCAGIAGIIITLSTFAAFIMFCMGASNDDLDKVGMGLGVFVTCVGTIAAGMWTYNLWFPSKRAHARIPEAEMSAEVRSSFGIFRSYDKEEATLAQVEEGTPDNIRKLHLACNVVTVILWYLFAVLIIFFTFDIRGLVTDASKFVPDPDDRIPVTNTTLPEEPDPFTGNSSSPTFAPTLEPPTFGPTLAGETYSPTASPTFIPTDSPSFVPTISPTSSEPTVSPSTSEPTSSPETSEPSASPSFSMPTTAPSESPTTSRPSQSPSRTPSATPSRSPSRTPTTSRPTDSPETSEPTSSPITPEPSAAPITSEPTNSPTTSKPSAAPTTPQPSQSPSTGAPSQSPSEGMTNTPTTLHPSVAPTTQRPSVSPLTSQPSNSPTETPTEKPTSQTPSRSPTTSFPSVSPTFSAPSKSPTTSRPSKSPSSSKPSKSPETSKPSKGPTTSKPTRSPTRFPTLKTRSPTSKAPTTGYPTSEPSHAPTSSPTRSPTNPFVPVPEPPPTVPPGTPLVTGTLHFVCVGDPNARPVVVLEHDVASTLDLYAWVHQMVSAHTYTCAYSRRGYGYSTPGNKPRTVQFTVVELATALDAMNITTPIVLVGHGFAGFHLLRFNEVYPDRVAALVFVDSYSPQCFHKPHCQGNAHKDDSEGYGYLETVIPLGFIRALAYAGLSFPGQVGQCYLQLPYSWGTNPTIMARDRFLATLLSPAFWAASLAEDTDMPTSCAFAAQAHGNADFNRINVPVVSIIAERGFYESQHLKKCGQELQKFGGGSPPGKSRKAYTRGVEVNRADHFTILCDKDYAEIVADEIVDVVRLVRQESKTYTMFTSAGKMTWANARDFCASKGQRLATILSQDSQSDVDDLRLNQADDNFWLGLTDQAEQNQWKWITGESVNLYYVNWQNNNEPASGSKDCVEILKTNGKWRTNQCSALRYPLCEKPDY